MDKEETKTLCELWETSEKIVKTIASIASLSPRVAYGILGEAKLIVDYVAQNRVEVIRRETDTTKKAEQEASTEK